MVFSLYCTAELIFVFFVCSILFFNHCISVYAFMLLCIAFCALLVILSLLLVIMGYFFLAPRLSITFDMHIKFM